MQASNGTAPHGATAKRTRAHVTGWGRYVPSQVLSNKDLERIVDTNDEWIVSRTGIRERRVAAAHETTASMGAVAGLRAIHAWAVANPYTKPEQAAATSIAAARVFPIASLTRAAVEGIQ